MRAAVFTKKESIEIQEVSLPELKRNEVLIENMACGVCGTDVHIYHGEAGSADVTPPVILGHEFSGRVVRVGSSVNGLQEGDHVTVDPNIYCGVCEACRMGKKQLCTDMHAIGVTQNGGFAEFSIVPSSQAFKLDVNVPFEEAAMTEPLACCLHGMDILKVMPGESVCIIGGGAIGLIFVQLAKLSGAAFVTVSEPNEKRRKTAIEIGADLTIDPTDSKQVADYINCYGGANNLIECAGNLSATRSAMQFAKPGASIMLFSVPHPDAKAEFSLFDIFKKELKILGSFVNPDTHLRAVKLINQGLIRFSSIISHKFGFSDTEKAIQMQTDENAVKVLVCADSLVNLV